MTSHRGCSLKQYLSVYSDHVGDYITRKPNTGINIYVNMFPILWYYKRQINMELYTFGF